MNWLCNLFAPKRRGLSIAEIAGIYGECMARSAEEDALFDIYWNLPDRPRHTEMWRVTETSPLVPVHNCVDSDHWAQWYLARTKYPMPSL